MRKIKTLLEFFDTEDLKSQYEIPYLQGEMPREISKFKNFNQGEDERLVDAMRFQFPVLNMFHYNVSNKGEYNLHFLYATSEEPVDGVDYYASLTLTYLKNQYVVVTLFRDLKETDKTKFDAKEQRFDDIHSAFPAVEEFVKRCKDLNILGDNDNFNLQSN